MVALSKLSPEEVRLHIDLWKHGIHPSRTAFSLHQVCQEAQRSLIQSKESETYLIIRTKRKRSDILLVILYKKKAVTVRLSVRCSSALPSLQLPPRGSHPAAPSCPDRPRTTPPRSRLPAPSPSLRSSAPGPRHGLTCSRLCSRAPVSTSITLRRVPQGQNMAVPSRLTWGESEERGAGAGLPRGEGSKAPAEGGGGLALPARGHRCRRAPSSWTRRSWKGTETKERDEGRAAGP